MTELDLQQSLIPVALIEHLSKVMPRNNDDEGYDYHSFLDGVVNGSSLNGGKHTSMGGEKNTSVDQLQVSGGMARGAKHYL